MVHYYQFNIGDYHAHTAHLDPLEDIAYRRMIDYCYLNEIPLPESTEEIARLIRMRSHSDCITVVLREFFTLTDAGYVQQRIDADLAKYREKSEKAKKSAEARWKNKPSKDEGLDDANALRPECEGNANHKPITINQEPYNKSGDKSPLCPHNEIIDLYHSILPELTTVKKSLWAGSNREKLLRSRWKQSEKHQTLEFWSGLFNHVSKSDFLMCRNSANFRGCTLEWIIKPANFIKIIEGNYHGE